MTKDDKLTIYNLLKTASDNYHGYASPAFAGDVPKFADDIAAPHDINPPASLPSIAEKITECRACPLCKGRTNTVPGMGVENPYVLVVGEGPGHDEDVSGLPFVGAAGKLLDKMLIAIQLDRNVNCYIANVVKCRPPNNRTPTHEEAAACGGFLRSQIDVLKPKMILAAGRTAAQYLLETDAPLGKLRGTFYNYHAAYGDVPLLVTYHPSALLRDESNKRPAWEDLKMFKSRLLEIAPDYAALIQ